MSDAVTLEQLIIDPRVLDEHADPHFTSAREELERLCELTGPMGAALIVDRGLDFASDHSQTVRNVALGGGLAVSVVVGSLAVEAPAMAQVVGNRPAAVQLAAQDGHETLHEDPPAAPAEAAPAPTPTPEADRGPARTALLLIGDSYDVGLKNDASTQQGFHDLDYDQINYVAGCGMHTNMNSPKSCDNPAIVNLLGAVQQLDQGPVQNLVRSSDTIVFSVGTNDPGDPQYGGNIVTLIKKVNELNPHARVFFDTLHSADPANSGKYPAMNDALKQATQANNANVADWDAYANTHPNAYDGGLHPRNYSQLGSVIAGAIGKPVEASAAVQASVQPQPEAAQKASVTTPTPAATPAPAPAAAPAAHNHKVKWGENLTTIAGQEHVSVQDIETANQSLGLAQHPNFVLTNTDLAIPGSTPEAANPAALVQQIAADNHLKNVNYIVAGQHLSISDGHGGRQDYVVKAGDTLFDIASRIAGSDSVGPNMTVTMGYHDSISLELRQHGLADTQANDNVIAKVNAIDPNHVMPGEKVVFPGNLQRPDGSPFMTSQPAPEAAPAPHQFDLNNPVDVELLHQYLQAVKNGQDQAAAEAAPAPAAAPAANVAPWAAEQMPAVMQKGDSLIPVYQEAEKETGVPWQILYTLDYRENNNNPNSSMFAGEPIGSRNPDHGDVKGSTKQENVVLAAQFFKQMAKGTYGVDVGPNMSRQDLEKAFLAWNRGALYQRAGMSPDQSPYVVNGENGNVYMQFAGGGEPASTRGHTDQRPGAMAVYDSLMTREQDAAAGYAAAVNPKKADNQDSQASGDQKPDQNPAQPDQGKDQAPNQGDPAPQPPIDLNKLTPEQKQAFSDYLKKSTDAKIQEYLQKVKEAKDLEAVGLAWPVQGPATITQCFGGPKGHPGMDIAGPVNAPVVAATDGVVTKAGPVSGYGNNFVALHNDATNVGTSYGHMNQMTVKAGDQVSKGQVIGYQGSQGESSGQHVHFNVFKGVYAGNDAGHSDPLQSGLVIPPGVNNPNACT